MPRFQADPHRRTCARRSPPAAARARLEAGGTFTIPPVRYERPLYYKCNRFSVVGPEADVHWPGFSQRMDYELELAVVIGRKAMGTVGNGCGYESLSFLSDGDVTAPCPLSP